jgi:glycosyltransferase involved in cell wall biosynthesis
LIKAAHIVVRKHPNTKFLIVGELDGEWDTALNYRTQLYQLVKDLDLQDHVIFNGFRNDIHILMNELDLLVQPSEHEALGTSMVEAMACGKPVIGTKVDGIPEVIGNDEGGRLLDPRTPEKLAELIISFIEKRESENDKWLQRRERVLQKFNVYKSIQRIHQIYEDALNPFYKESDGLGNTQNEHR